MTEAENQGVLEEIASPEAEGFIQDQHEGAVETQERQPTDQEVNFQRLREKADQTQRELEKERQERDRDRQMMMELQQALLKKEGTEQPKADIDPFADIDRSDWATVELTEQLAQRAAEKTVKTNLEKAFSEWEEKRNRDELPKRLKDKYSDIFSVVTDENIEKLKAREPEICQALDQIGSEENKAIAAYKYIKLLMPEVAEDEAVKRKLAENAAKPQSLSAAGGKSPLSNMDAFQNGLTPTLKEQLYKEALACARR